MSEHGASANIPPGRNRKEPIPHLYRARNLVERFFNKIKQSRRVTTRSDELASIARQGVDSLKRSHSRIDANWMKAEVVGRKLVVASSYPPTLFDLVEEPFDQVAGTIEIRAEADRVVAIASWRDVGPSASVGGKGPDFISAFGEQPTWPDLLSASSPVANDPKRIYQTARSSHCGGFIRP